MIVSVVMAAPTTPVAYADGNAKCEVSAFRPDWSKITKCCLDNTGGSNFDRDDNELQCTLPLGKLPMFVKCVKGLGYASTIDCDVN
ncbi:hypothetical protein BGZ95_004323 [Linnemannia exigua]|uniref:Uncharacterized protein n=1 Tax=Linnemannia exigua TaxID=604196 RepID=A0AAD4D365_9FUNG|nr:hypothetical protein BGZ95_004323 [Linnemannia exigua]